MSIDNRIWVPATTRTFATRSTRATASCRLRNIRRTRCSWRMEGTFWLMSNTFLKTRRTPAGSGKRVTRNECIFAGPETHGYDRMALWVNDRLEAERSNPRN